MKVIYKWLVIAILTGQLLLAGVFFPIVNFSPAFLVLSVLLTILVLLKWLAIDKGKIYISKDIKRSVSYAFILVVLIAFSYLINGYFLYDKFVLTICTFFLGIATYYAIEDKEDISFLLLSFVLISAISALFQLGQLAGIPICKSIWYIVQRGDKLGFNNSSRYLLGLASDPIAIAYQMSAAYTITLLYPFKKFKILKPILVSLFIVSLWLAQTRSAILGIMIPTLYWAWNSMKLMTKIKALSISSFSAVVLTLFIMSKRTMPTLIETSRFVTDADTVGTVARIPMLLTAFNHALHAPLGMGVYKKNANYIVGASGKIYDQVLSVAPHNIFANCVVKHGFLSLGFLLAYYASFLNAFRSTVYKRNMKLHIAAFWGIVVLFINSLTHNNDILSGDFTTHMLIGIFLSYHKFTCKEQEGKND